MRNKLIIFDFDGTLVHTSEFYYNKYYFSVKKNGLQAAKQQEFIKVMRQFTGYTWDKVIKYLHPDIDLDTFYISWDRIHTANTARLDGCAINLLSWLKHEGCKVACLSASNIEMLELHMKEFSMYDMFDLIVARQEKLQKPDARLLDRFIEEFNVTNQDIIYVGDTLIDYMFSVNACIDFWGICANQEIKNEFLLAGAKGQNLSKTLNGFLNYMKGSHCDS